MKILTIIGARPQIIKASALSRAITNYYSDKINEIIVHTGQHYDENMSDIFFSQLNIPKPKYNLNVGSCSHAKQTATMMIGIENIIDIEKPDAVIIYGDTNSTIAAALTASKMNIPVVHIEAGLRSFDKNMPEEVNRILTDNVSTLLFCPTKTGYDNLIREGFSSQITKKPNFNTPNIYFCGDVMYDNTIYFKDIAQTTVSLNTLLPQNLTSPYILCTIHRNNNTDDKRRLENIFSSLYSIAQNYNIILPMHPRTKKMFNSLLSNDLKQKILDNKNIYIIEPVGYLQMLYLENNASLIITDSGGVQKEAFFLQKHCIILRKQTEWIEIVQSGGAVIADDDKDKIINGVNDFIKFDNIENNSGITKFQIEKIFKTPEVSKFICQTIYDCLA